MKKYLVFTVVLFAACSATLLTPTQSDVSRVSSKYPGYSIEQLNEGKAIYEKNCKSCHGLKDPKSRNEAEWKEVVPRMVAKVNKKAGTTQIDKTKEETLLKYLVTMSTSEQK